jgi:hypothetical protein
MSDRWRRFIRRWVPTIGGSATPSDDRARAAAATARDQRADDVLRLQHEVRALQQRITDLGAAQEQDGAGADSARQQRALQSLYRALAHAQGELANLQARI